MIRAIVRFGFEHRVAVIAAWLALAVAGVRALVAIPIDPFPDPDDVHVTVVAQFPGKAAEEVETLVTRPLERAINGVPGLTNLRSTSTFGLSVIKTTFDDATTDDFARQQVFERIAQVQLPPGVQPQMGPLTDSTGEIYRYRVEGPGVSVYELRAIQDWTIVPALKALPGVADVNAFGGGSKRFSVNVDPTLLRAHGVTLGDVQQALASGNANGGGSVVEKGGQEYAVRSVGLLKEPKDVESIAVAARRSTPITIGHVARVERTTAPRRGFVAMDGDDDVVMGVVLLRKGENATEVVRRVRERLQALNESELPRSVRIVSFYDRSEMLERTLRTVLENALEGLVLVLVVLVVFMGDLRSSAIVVSAVPLAVLFAFFVLHAMGETANLLSLGAIDFGIVVNAAVIVVEAMLARLALLGPEDDRDARLEETVQELGPPIFFATLIIITLNVPILTFQRVEGRIFRPLAITVGLAILGALILALTLVPQLATVGLRAGAGKNRLVLLLERVYERLLARALVWRKTVLVTASLGCALGFFATSGLGTEFLPRLDEGNIWINCVLPTSVAAREAKRIEARLRAVLREYPEGRFVFSQLGRPEDGTDARGVDYLEVMVDLVPHEQWPLREINGERRRLTKEELVANVEERLSVFPGIEYTFSQYIQDNVNEALSGVDGDIAVKVFGSDLPTLQRLAQKIAKAIERVPGAESVHSERISGQPALSIEVDRERAARAGVGVDDIQRAIEIGVGGAVATTFVVADRAFDVAVRLARDARDGEERIADIVVPRPEGGSVPLREVATVAVRSGATQIKRESNQRRVAVMCNIKGRDLGGFVQEAMAAVEREVTRDAKVWPASGYRITWEGEFENQRRAVGRLTLIIPACVALVSGFLFWTFRSARTAALILVTVPLGLVGGLLGLMGTRSYVGISAVIGFITLGGIAVENGVVLVSRIHSLRGLHHVPIDEAIVRGCVERLRAVLMASLTAALGFAPAVGSHGMGAEVRKPLAIVVVFGTLSACAFTLFVLPCLYRIVEWREVESPAGAH
jgi:cobalt-zinc-cadmium resistance protein CzcA